MAKRTRGFTVSQSSGSSKNLSPSLEVDWKDWNKLREWTEPVPSAAPPTSQSVSIPPADAPNAATVAVLVSWTQAPMMRVCSSPYTPYVNVNTTNWFGWKWVNPIFSYCPWSTSSITQLFVCLLCMHCLCSENVRFCLRVQICDKGFKFAHFLSQYCRHITVYITRSASMFSHVLHHCYVSPCRMQFFIVRSAIVTSLHVWQ